MPCSGALGGGSSLNPLDGLERRPKKRASDPCPKFGAPPRLRQEAAHPAQHQRHPSGVCRRSWNSGLRLPTQSRLALARSGAIAGILEQPSHVRARYGGREREKGGRGKRKKKTPQRGGSHVLHLVRRRGAAHAAQGAARDGVVALEGAAVLVAVGRVEVRGAAGAVGQAAAPAP